jgi:hypothetical protein
MRKLLTAAVLVCAVLAPALAYSQAPTSGTFKAYDYGWTATPGGGTELRLTRPATVEFSYPSGANAHTVNWTSSAKPTCSGVPTGFDFPGGAPGWKGTCSFDKAGEYSFACGIHPDMTGKVILTAAVATTSPTPTASASPAPTPQGTATPTQPPANGGGTAAPPTTTTTTPTTAGAPVFKVAASQKGTRVRGTVTVGQRSRIEATVKLGKRRVGRTVRTADGTTRFSVTLDARARKQLRRRHSLKLRVTVAVTPPGAAKQQRTFSVKLRR